MFQFSTKELGARGITVNAVAPGPTATTLFLDDKGQATIDRIVKAAPLGRLGQPDDITAEHGRIDVVMHNAGHRMYGPTEAFTPEQLAQQYDTNVLSTQRVNCAALPHMRKAGRGLLIWNSSSSVAGGTPPYLGPYFAAKAGMDALAVSLARELVLWSIETSIVVLGAFTRGTNHFANAGHPADETRAAKYDAGPYAGFGGACRRLSPGSSRRMPTRLSWHRRWSILSPQRRVIARSGWSWIRPIGPFMGLAVNGRHVPFSENVFYRFDDGRIDAVWSVVDRATIEAQLNPCRVSSTSRRQGSGTLPLPLAAQRRDRRLPPPRARRLAQPR